MSKNLFQIVGDPAMPEAKWMAACVLAGDKSLVPRETLAHRFWTALMAGSGALFSVLTAFLSFIVALFLAGHLAWFFGGVDLNTFMNIKTDGLGLLFAVFGGLSFWTSLLFRSQWTRRIVASVSAVMLGLAAIGYGESGLGVVGISFMAIMCILCTAGLAHTGSVLKEALPKSFGAKKLAGSQMAVFSLPAVLTLSLIWSVSTSSTGPTPYEPADTVGLFMHLAVLSFCVVLPGIAIARASLSKSMAACITLATSVQLPLLIGILLSVLMSGFETGGLTRPMFVLATLAITACLAGAGGLIGASVNRRL
jgi:hypothetical protein